MAFQALELALDAIRHLVAPLADIARRDPDLAKQIRRAAASMALNLGEGSRRAGGDRLPPWRVASGSAAEAVTALRVAEAFGYVDLAATTSALERCDRGSPSRTRSPSALAREVRRAACASRAIAAHRRGALPRFVRSSCRARICHVRRIAGIVSAVCLVGLGALWWAVPCNLKVDVRVPEETRAELLAVFVLAQDPRGLYRIQAERQESFPDQQARSAAFTVRVPRGEYRVVVDCDGSDRFDERVRVITNRTVSVTLSAHPGRKAGSVEV